MRLYFWFPFFPCWFPIPQERNLCVTNLLIYNPTFLISCLSFLLWNFHHVLVINKLCKLVTHESYCFDPIVFFNWVLTPTKGNKEFLLLNLFLSLMWFKNISILFILSHMRSLLILYIYIYIYILIDDWFIIKHVFVNEVTSLIIYIDFKIIIVNICLNVDSVMKFK